MEILQVPDEILSRTAQPFLGGKTLGVHDSQTREEIYSLVVEMEKTLKDIPLGYAGLAAPQVGVSKRLFLFAPFTREIRAFVDPSWTPLSDPKPAGVPLEGWGTDETKEGCFSANYAKIVVPVRRWKRILAEGLEVINWHRGQKKMDFRAFRSELLGWEARVWQHEHDHLEGVILGGCKFDKNEHPPQE